jgi:predicted Zn-dependent protease
MTKHSKFFLPLIYIIIFIVGIGLYQGNETINSGVNVFIHETQIQTQNIINKVTGKKKHQPKLTKDNKQKIDQRKTYTKPVGKWPSNSATIYIDIKDPVLRSAAKTAIKSWNNTGVFTFHVIKDQKKANILFTTIDNDHDGAAGLTEANINSGNGNFIYVKVELNSAYLLDPVYGYSQRRIVNTAEHELGHAIGLHHSNDVSVMQPSGSNYPIQQNDIQNVKLLYSKKNPRQIPAANSSSTDTQNN